MRIPNLVVLSLILYAICTTLMCTYFAAPTTQPRRATQRSGFKDDARVVESSAAGHGSDSGAASAADSSAAALADALRRVTQLETEQAHSSALERRLQEASLQIDTLKAHPHSPKKPAVCRNSHCLIPSLCNSHCLILAVPLSPCLSLCLYRSIVSRTVVVVG